MAVGSEVHFLVRTEGVGQKEGEEANAAEARATRAATQHDAATAMAAAAVPPVSMLASLHRKLIVQQVRKLGEERTARTRVLLRAVLLLLLWLFLFLLLSLYASASRMEGGRE